METIKEIEIGVFVWFYMERGFMSPFSSCFCVMTYVDDTSFRLKKLDDLSELPLFNFSEFSEGDSCKCFHQSIRICTLDEVNKYIREQLSERVKEVVSTQEYLKQIKEEIVDYEKEVKKLLKKYS